MFNNVLLQIQGKKTVIVFDAEHGKEIGLQHYIILKNNKDIFCKENIDDLPWLGKLPYKEIALNPGDALVIPSTCYHAPKAKSSDTVSLNVFLTPKILKNYNSPFAITESNRSTLVENLRITISKIKYKIIGSPLVSWGPYEFF